MFARYKRFFFVFTVLSLTVLSLTSIALAANVLRVCHTFTQPERVEFMEKVAKDFEKEYDAKVELEIVPWDKVRDKWVTAAAARSLPDVMVGTPNDAMAIWIAGSSTHLNDVYEELGGEKFFMSDIVNKLCNYKGDLIALPLYAHTRLLIYRADIFKEVGVKAPETWDELLEVTKKVNNPPTRYGAMQFWGLGDRGATIYLYSLLRANESSYLDENFNAKFDTPEFIETVKMLVDWYNVGSPPGELGLKFHEQWFTSFVSGINTMGIDTMFIASTVKAENPELYDKGAVGACRIPVNEGKKLGYYCDTPSLILTNGSNPELAKEFIKYMYEPARYVDFLLTMPGGQFPVIYPASDSEVLWSHPIIKENEEGVKATLDGIAAGGTLPGMTYGVNPYAPLIEESNVIERMMHSIVGENVPIEEAVLQAQADLQKNIDDLRSRIGE